MRRRNVVGAAVVMAASTLALVVGVTVAAGAGVDPSSVTQTLTSGSSTTIIKTVHTPAIPPNPDIVFLADATGSMGPAASNVALNATTIMNTVNAGVPAGSVAEFAAADYLDGTVQSDCPVDPYPFKVDQGLTTTLSDVQTAINTWPTTASMGFGCDTPESQINALWQIANGAISFRGGSTRVVVWFGDSSGHDPSFGHTLGDAISALQTAHITVLAVPVSTPPPSDGLDATGQATAVASATGGQVLPAATPSQVANAILSGLTNLPVTVTPSAICDPGLSATFDFASKTVTSGTDVNFTETLTVAPNAPDGGVLHCSVDFLLNGVSVPGFQEAVAITVPLRPTDLTLVKTVSPTFVTEGNNVTYTLTVKNNGTDPDTNVVATDTLPGGESFVSGDAGCSAVAQVVTCNFGTIGAGATASKSYVAHVALGAPTTLVNAASVTGDRPESNPADNSSHATVTVNHNPICTNLTAGPELWPPNHKFVTVTVTGATDPDGNPLTTTITGVTQDEPLLGLGSGNTSPDAAGVAGHANQVQLRAERDGTGDGRVYRIATTVSDGLGGMCTGVAKVTVPHDQSGAPAVDSGTIVNSFGP
jgi:uncharacterized repeat protein (TIGR01451 family)